MTTNEHAYRNPAAEAQAVVGASASAQVLEPSPPAIDDGNWFADDPVSQDAAGQQNMVRPVGVAGPSQRDWSTWLTDNPEHADWVSARWLGGTRSLTAPPASLEPTRLALHRLAAYVIAPVRHQANGKFGLRWTLGGFGTPFFGQDRQIRVEGTDLIDQRDTEIRVASITSLREAAAFLETDIDTETAAEHDSPAVGDIDETLNVDGEAARFLGDWYGMAFAALEQVRADSASTNPSRPQIWPGHFDPAIEVGDDDHRGSYGASPGDHTIAEPYLYVSAWWPDRLSLDLSDPAWNAPSFTGAILKLSDFGPGDSVEQAANFFATTRDMIEQ